MAVYKEEKTNTWRAVYRFTDWTGEKKQTQKRGFKTKREAQAWEREQLHKVSADLDMTFASFYEQYTADMQTRIKENTWATKEHIIRTKLIPYFGKLKMSSITAQQIITWQNELMNYKDEKGNPLSPVYLKTIHNQLSAIFNHAVKYYNLRENPCKKAGSMGKKKNREMLFWTKEEYLKFAEVMMDKPQSYYAFEMLYWCGIREGELLALTPADFNFEKNTKETAGFEKKKARIEKQEISLRHLEQIEAKPIPLSSKVAVEKTDFESMKTAVRKYIVQERKESKLQKALDAAKKLITELQAELKAVKDELVQYKSVLGKLDRAGLERENAELREKVRWYDSIIDAKNLRNLFTRHDHRRQQERH